MHPVRGIVVTSTLTALALKGGHAGFGIEAKVWGIVVHVSSFKKNHIKPKAHQTN